jgi:hypothetical protein
MHSAQAIGFYLVLCQKTFINSFFFHTRMTESGSKVAVERACFVNELTVGYYERDRIPNFRSSRSFLLAIGRYGFPAV